MVDKFDLTADQLRDLLDYDQHTGVFTWKVTRGKARVGAVAGCVNGNGYWLIRVYGRLYKAHRLAWLHVHGRWPVGDIDHVNGRLTDNRMTNLRECTESENLQNMKKVKATYSGVIGVHRARKKWTSSITVRGRRYPLGMFSSPQEAHQAYVTAKAGLHTFNPVLRG